MTEAITDPKVVLFAILGGLMPALLWLWFWFKNEDNEEREPLVLIITSFILGGLLVLIAGFLQKATLGHITDKNLQIVAWASIEEALKMAAVLLIIMGTKIIRRPIDYPMYFIAVALGFAGLENIFYLLDPISTNGTVVGLLTGNLRYLGSTLLHAIASSMMGSALGLAFYTKSMRGIYLFFGLFCAIILHSIFNFYIMKDGGANFLSVFGFLWVVAIINILIFEKLRRMGRYVPVR